VDHDFLGENKMITKSNGDVFSTVEITHTDNGQVSLHVTSKLGNQTHTHTATVGAEDGKDLVSSLSEDELKTLLQKHLDEKCAEAASVLSGRAKVAKVVSLLV
jgi:hypothetical protein